jgi:hypothetical protein
MPHFGGNIPLGSPGRIHGQMIYANIDTGLVAAKPSSWPEPQHAVKLFTALRAFDTLPRL